MLLTSLSILLTGGSLKKSDLKVTVPTSTITITVLLMSSEFYSIRECSCSYQLRYQNQYVRSTSASESASSGSADQTRWNLRNETATSDEFNLQKHHSDLATMCKKLESRITLTHIQITQELHSEEVSGYLGSQSREEIRPFCTGSP